MPSIIYIQFSKLFIVFSHARVYRNISKTYSLILSKMSLISEEKLDQMEKDISWDEDPLVFIFHKEQPEKVKMMTHRLNMKDWIRMDKTYPG